MRLSRPMYLEWSTCLGVKIKNCNYYEIFMCVVKFIKKVALYKKKES